MSKRLLNTFAKSHTMPDGTSEVRTCKVYRDADWEEYVVKMEQNGIRLPSATYHTPDKDDALGTAQMMVERS